jgi:hypothetical protein
MSAIDWFWTGRNNVVDRQHPGIRFEVGVVRVAAYWLGAFYGALLRMAGVRE